MVWTKFIEGKTKCPICKELLEEIPLGQFKLYRFKCKNKEIGVRHYFM